ncbi:MAG: M48 family metalloprotease [Alphaproteobacteria bacterium]|nr:M48 family metalloprotease [Alphaproteobacteria bacterium]
MKHFIYSCLVMLWSLGGFSPLEAATHLPQNVLIRDAEIEQAIKDFVSPLFKVAGLDAKQLKVMVIFSNEVNAAAGLQYTLYINTGLILQSKNLGQLIGVLAHETGHLAGRHNERLLNMGNYSIVPMLGAILIGGAVAAMTGTPEPFLAGIMGGMEVSENSILAYHRGHEGSADQAAFQYMEKLGWSSQGFMEFMQKLHKQDLLSPERQYAYKRTHPFMIDRMRLLEKHCKNSAHQNAVFPQGFEEKFARIHAKITGYSETPQRLLQKYPMTNQTLPAKYIRAIAFHQSNQTMAALKEIDELLAQHPQDPYFLEFKGQIYFETGQTEKAIEFYQQARKILPQNGLITIQLAHIMLESKGPDRSAEAITLLNQAQKTEKESAFIWRLYATAYGRLKQEGMVSLMLAEEAVQLGDVEKAHKLADKALKQLPTNQSTQRQRAKDIKTLDATVEENS